MIGKPIRKEVSGYCPHLGRESQIFVEYSDVPSPASSSEVFTMTSFECGNADGCEFEEKCPLCEKDLESRP